MAMVKHGDLLCGFPGNRSLPVRCSARNTGPVAQAISIRNLDEGFDASVQKQFGHGRIRMTMSPSGDIVSISMRQRKMKTIRTFPQEGMSPSDDITAGEI